MLKTSSVSNFPYTADNVSYFFLKDNNMTELVTYNDFTKAYDATLKIGQFALAAKPTHSDANRIIAIRAYKGTVSAYLVDDMEKFASAFNINRYVNSVLQYPIIYIVDACREEEWGKIRILIKFQTKERDEKLTDKNIASTLEIAINKALLANKILLHEVVKGRRARISIKEFKILREPSKEHPVPFTYHINPDYPQYMEIECYECSPKHNLCEWDFKKGYNVVLPVKTFKSSFTSLDALSKAKGD